jgi:Ala-tRNA(Pro) deacylase
MAQAARECGQEDEMAINERVSHFLEQNHVEHEVLPHMEVYTAQEVAQSVHVAGRMMAKVVVVREPAGGHAMVVLPASCHLDLGVLGRETGRPGAMLASEAELQRLFPDCEVGAMPPFGRLYDLPMYLDRCLERSTSVFFQAGNHHEVVRMRTEDFVRLVRPLAGEFCMHREEQQV